MRKITKLPNQLEIIAAPLSGTKTITVLVMAATGSRFENKNNSGISHFLEHMFFKGTVKRPTTLAISSELDRVGGEFNAFTGKEYTGYFVKVEAGRLKLALDVLSDILLNSKFAAEEIEREKGVIIEELNMYLDNPLIYIEDLFEECLYGDTPAGRDTIGTKETILKMDRKKILDYMGSQYSSDKMIVSLAGGFKPADIKLINKYFNNFFKKDYKEKLKTNDEQARPKLNLFYKKTDQAHLSLGVRTYAYGSPDEITAKIISLILGGTMSSRLFTELRERRGLAYYVRTHNEPYTDSGYLTTQAGVPIAKAAEAIKIILAEYKKITEKLVSAEELNRVKQCLIGRTTLNLESSDSLANWYARQAILFKEQNNAGEILTPEKYYTRIKKVTALDIGRVAKEIFVKQKLNLAVIGPYKDKEEFEKMLVL
ncbi:MAG: pitrilysin family protein [Patescibacteria group bacterium]|nr:pitrilysin family protein [Patescibacteria group bacterium]